MQKLTFGAKSRERGARSIERGARSEERGGGSAKLGFGIPQNFRNRAELAQMAFAVFRNGQRMSGWKRGDSTIKRERIRYRAPKKETDVTGGIDRCVDVSAGE